MVDEFFRKTTSHHRHCTQLGCQVSQEQKGKLGIQEQKEKQVREAQRALRVLAQVSQLSL